MEPLHFLQILILVFATAGIVVYAFQRLRLPSVVGLLVAGMLLGPTGFSLVPEIEVVQLLAEVGVVVLLFAVGLEFSLSRLWGLLPLMLKVGAPQVLVSGAVALLATWWYLGGLGPAVLAGMLVAMSSTAIVLKVLTDRGELDAPHGRIAIAVLLLQDLLVVACMLLLPLLAHQEGGAPLWLATLRGFGVIAAVLAAARYLVPPVLHAVVRTRNRELFLILIVVTCLGTAALTAWVGLSLALGAFLAGLALSESEYAHQTLAEVLPFRDTLASLFFVSVGMLLDLHFVAANAPLVLATVAVLVALKFLAAGVPTLLGGYPGRVAVLTGLALAQIGEFSFVLASRGLELGLLRPDDYQIFLAAAVLSIAVTPLLIAASPRIAERLSGRLRRWARRWLKVSHLPPLTGPIAALTDHVLIVGYGVNGRNVARTLREVDVPHVVLEMNPETVRQGQRRGEPLVYGDCSRPAVLEHLGVRRARVLVVAISDPASVRRCIHIARQMNAKLYIIVRTRYVAEVEDLRGLGADAIIPEEFETSVEIFARVLRKFEVPHNVIVGLIDQVRRDHYEVLRTFRLPSMKVDLPTEILRQFRVEFCLVPADSPAVGRSVGEVNLRAATGVLLLAVRRAGELLPNPGPDWRFQANDVAVLVGNREQVDRGTLLLDPRYGQAQARASLPAAAAPAEGTMAEPPATGYAEGAHDKPSS